MHRGIKTPRGIKTTPNSGALKGRNKGKHPTSIASDERVPTRAIRHLVRPFQGEVLPLIFGPQGVALGWNVMTPSGRIILQDDPR